MAPPCVCPQCINLLVNTLKRARLRSPTTDSLAFHFYINLQVMSEIDTDKRAKLSEELLECTRPAAESIACRLALFGTCGELWADNSFIKMQFANAGDIGKQLLTKMETMEKDGWHFGPMSVQDPGSKSCIIPEKISFNNPKLEKLVNSGIKRTTIISSNLSMLTGVGAICNDVGRVVGYNNVASIASTLTGCFANVSSPAKTTVESVAHEIGHHDGIAKLYSLKQTDRFTKQEATDYAKRCIISEGRAHLTQATFAEAANVKSHNASMIKNHALNGTLGEFIHSRYKHDPAYAELKLLSGSDCNKAVNEHLEECFGKELLDPSTKKLTIKDINSGFGKEIGKIRLDSQLLAKMQNRAYSELESSKLLNQIDSLSKSLHNPLIGRVAQGLAGAGTLWTIGDLGSAFAEGPRNGAGRIASIATNWLGWEIGGALGSLPGRLIPKQASIAVLVGSFIGSTLAAEFIGIDLEQTIKRSNGST